MKSRYLGIDYGEFSIGVALSSPSGNVAYGKSTLRRKDSAAFKPILKALKEIINENHVTHIVLGIPKHMNGDDGDRAGFTLLFKEKLERYFKNKPVLLWDERLSTKAVMRVAGKKSRIDEMAAVYILQGFLDKLNLEENMSGTNIENGDEGIVLVNDDGEEIPLTILTSRDDETGTYILAAEENEDGEAAIFKCIPEGEEEIIFELVDGEHEDYAKVLKLFKEDFETLGIDVEEGELPEGTSPESVD